MVIKIKERRELPAGPSDGGLPPATGAVADLVAGGGADSAGAGTASRGAPPEPAISFAAVPEFPQVQAGLSAKVPFVVLAHLEGKEFVPDVERTCPMRLAIAIDVSGSMNGEKLEQAKASLLFIISELTDRDELAIVAFETAVRTVLPLTCLDDRGKAAACSAVSGLRHMGCTNLSGGLFRSLALVCDSELDALCDGASTADHPLLSQQCRPGAGSAVPTTKTVTATATERHSLPPLVNVHVSHHHTIALRADVAFHSLELKVRVEPLAAAAGAGAVEGGGPALAASATRVMVRIGGERFPPREGAGTAEMKFVISPRRYLPDAVEVVFEASGAPPCVYHITAASKGEGGSGEGRRHFQILEGRKVTVVSTADERCPTKDCGSETAEGKSDRVPRQRALRSVMIFTDGNANAGIANVGHLTSTLRERLSAQEALGVSVSTFGFGASHDANMLRSIAEISQGSYYYVADSATMREAFGDCLGGLLSVVATDLRVSINVDPRVASIARVMTHLPVSYGDYDSPPEWPRKQAMAPPGCQRCEVRLKDLYASEKRDLPVELSVHPHLAETAALLPLACMSLSYHDVALAAAVQTEAAAHVAIAPEAYTGLPHLLVDEQRNRFTLAAAMDAAREAADGDDRDGARKILHDARTAALSTPSAASTTVTAMVGHIAESIAHMESAKVWRDEGTKRISNFVVQHLQQRSAVTAQTSPATPSASSTSGSVPVPMYGNAAKDRMRTKAVTMPLLPSSATSSRK